MALAASASRASCSASIRSLCSSAICLRILLRDLASMRARASVESLLRMVRSSMARGWRRAARASASALRSLVGRRYVEALSRDVEASM